jgi:hypothetical protein
MPKILIMNAGTEQMSGTHLTDVQRSLAAKSAWRSVWFAEEGDLIISPVPIQSDLLAHLGRTLKFDSSSISVIVPESLRTGAILSDLDLESDRLIEEIIFRVHEPSRWIIAPCYFTEGVANLVATLGISQRGQIFAAQRGCDLLNRKSHFRQLATGSELPIPKGCIVTSSNELFRAVMSLSRDTGRVIIKLDNGAGGVGNVILTKDKSVQLPGGRETRQIIADGSFDADELWSEISTPSCKTAVVECYHPASHTFYLEYNIDDAGSISYINSGTIRLRPSEDPLEKALIWTGLELPADLSKDQHSAATGYAYRFVKLAREIGYRGPINIDAIVTIDGDLLFNEANARWGGGSVMHTVADRLLGTDFPDHFVILSVRSVRLSSLQSALDYLSCHNLLFDDQSNEGVIVLAADESSATVECLVVARERSKVRQLEHQLLTVL